MIYKNEYFKWLQNEASDDNLVKDEPSFLMLPEAVKAYRSAPEDSLDMEDLDVLYSLTVGIWKISVKKKKSFIDKSHLPISEKDRLKKLLEELAITEKGEKYGLFGSGFVSFASFRKDENTFRESAKRFISMCCDVLDMEENDALDRAENALATPIHGMRAGSVSQILFCMRPTVFPNMNSEAVKACKKVIELDHPGRLVNYIANARKIKAMRDEHFSFRNYLMFDHHHGLPDNLDKIDPKKTIPDWNLNQILYGPPGTGKTYQTAQMAVSICDNLAMAEVEAMDRSEVMDRYRVLEDDSRISFVTFHQSFSYEEFVEGLRPVARGHKDFDDEAGGNVQYQIVDGVFKTMCNAANPIKQVSGKNYNVVPGKVRLWKMSLGNTARSEEAYLYNDCIENGCVLLGYGQGLDYSNCADRDSIKAKLQSKTSDISKYDFNITEMDLFKNRMSVGDLVFVSQGNRKIRAIGKITGEYEFKAPEEYGQKRDVEWLYVPEEPIPAESLFKKSISQLTLYELDQKATRWTVLNELLAGPAESHDVTQNYVLVIDEINRGNISKIFGELITLLEADKRADAENALRVKLPYSQEEFAVPSNLYLIGTMNTADRSIALMDTALRRRFSFKEIMPDPELLEALDDVDLTFLLQAINDRIEVLYDRDHTIGHASFMNIASLDGLRQVFLEKIIPLLQEYFYGDWEKVCVVLGCADTRSVNKYPIIEKQNLNTAGIPEHLLDDFSTNRRYGISGNFLTAMDDSLPQYFINIYSPGETNSQ
ncbi:MAG: AAA family ATPase [Deltaproteobacteria bacterium]|nr:AAA family ATPase [Deltaproteobacteria bacterium]